jgi:hypothetical protein
MKNRLTGKLNGWKFNLMSHTPGPWTVAYGSVYSESGECRIAYMDRDEPMTKPTERDANAQLIAAAPEMLEALEGMTDMFERHIENRPGPNDAAARWDKARAAIAKARGVK